MIKKLQQTVLLLIIISELSFPQWSTDPNNNLIIGYGLDPHICSDSTGGCYVTYDYESLSYPRKLALERLDKYGYKPWGDKKQILGELPEQWHAEIIEDGEGGVIVGYDDYEWIPPAYIKARIRVQKVDSSGNLLWGSTGVRVTLSETNQGEQKLISDGNSGCIVAWGDTLNEYRINRINNLGQRLWGDSGKVIESNSSGYPLLLSKLTKNNFAFNYGRILYGIKLNGDFIYRDSLQHRLVDITSDGCGGVVASWLSGSTSNIQIVSQRKDSLGNSVWQEPYVVIADSLDYNNTLIRVQDNNGDFYYSWIGKKNGVDKVAQSQAIRLDGTKLFSEGSIPLSNYPIDAGLGGILPSDSGTVVFVWEDFRPDDGVFAQKVDTSGNKLWDPGDVRLYTGTYADLFTTTDGCGGAIGLGWHQYDFSLRMFKVSKNGIMGEVITEVKDYSDEPIFEEYFLYQNYPNPFNSSTIIKYQIPQEGMVIINLYNILGEKIKTLIEGEQTRGVHQLVLSSEPLSSGVYFYTLSAESLMGETGSLVVSKKLTIIK